MKLWDISCDGGFWKVQLDVKDLDGHLDFTCRVRAGNLSHKIGEATVGVAVVRCQQVFKSSWAWYVVGIFLLASTLLKLHMFSSSFISTFFAAIVRAVWSTEMPLATFLDILLSS